ncbi:hypothetical protein [Varibaculum massiliense]|uniref:hypothetical protein n=1 Tax=Varibaculum massiliense TaxID=1852372 RepID=UPI0008DB0432|nr:hypothetical protein [Varibaculum massiliense]
MKKWLFLIAIAAVTLSACSPVQPREAPSNSVDTSTSASRGHANTSAPATPDAKSEQPKASAKSTAKTLPSSKVNADQKTPQGAVMLYLKAFASQDTATLCKTITTSTVNRLESLGQECESTYQESAVPDPAKNLSKLQFRNSGYTSDGRGVSVLVTSGNKNYSFVCVDEGGTWHVDPESYTRQ